MRLVGANGVRTIFAGIVASATVVAGGWFAIPAVASEEATPIVVGTVSGLDPDKIVVENHQPKAEYHYTLDLPAGATMRALVDSGSAAIEGEVLLEDAAGNVIGAYDQPLAMGADSGLLPSTYRIDGSTLIQVVDFTNAEFPVVIDPIYSTATPPGMMGILAFVGVPSNYVYNPSLGARHDYCTNSPDEFPSATGANAKFHGPCARHDMCYDSSTSKLTCDNRLLDDMRSNCRHWYTSLFDPNRSACLATAEVYWAVVVVAN